GAGCPATSTEQVGRDHEEAVGVECLAWTDHAVPPHEPLAPRPVPLGSAESIARAFLRRCARDAGGVRVAAQRVADEDDIVAPGGERAVGLVGECDAGRTLDGAARE